jgi:hypothetical protein
MSLSHCSVPVVGDGDSVGLLVFWVFRFIVAAKNIQVCFTNPAL